MSKASRLVAMSSAARPLCQAADADCSGLRLSCSSALASSVVGVDLVESISIAPEVGLQGLSEEWRRRGSRCRERSWRGSRVDTGGKLSVGLCACIEHSCLDPIVD